MGADTRIEWTHHTFNPWHGCVRVSPGCKNCYAEAFDRRTHGTARHVTAKGEIREPHWGADAPRRFFGDKHWGEPVKWNRDAERDGVRRRVFCASMADVFEDRPDIRDARATLFHTIGATPHLDWLLLTKRPENIARLWEDATAFPPPWPNVWLGTTVENQQRADERIPHLLAVPAAVRFLSVEPLLGPVDFRVPFNRFARPGHTMHGADGLTVNTLRGVGGGDSIPGIDWVIVGGESGPGARPCDVAWIRDVVRQCREAGVPVFVKQLGARLAFHGIGVITPNDPKGGDPLEWPNDLRVREFPARRAKA